AEDCHLVQSQNMELPTNRHCNALNYQIYIWACRCHDRSPCCQGRKRSSPSLTTVGDDEYWNGEAQV
ncbi:hypothetical protein MKX03_022149, partial [Papaver bracteatum]